MCVVSMIIQDSIDRWLPWTVPPITVPSIPVPPPFISPDNTIPQWFKDLEGLRFDEQYRRAKEYDERNNEPDCELEDKKKLLLELAKQLGIPISFDEGEKK